LLKFGLENLQLNVDYTRVFVFQQTYKETASLFVHWRGGDQINSIDESPT